MVIVFSSSARLHTGLHGIVELPSSAPLRSGAHLSFCYRAVENPPHPRPSPEAGTIQWTDHGLPITRIELKRSGQTNATGP